MAGANIWDSLEAFQLKECYDLAARFETLDTARAVLREKSKGIDIPQNYVPVQADVSYPETEMQIASEIIYALTLEDFAASDRTGFKYSHKMNDLADSGEKEFILALLSLRDGTNVTQRIDAMRHIRAALKHSPDDPRYITLAEILQDVDK